MKESLKRLQLESVDIVYCHRPDNRVVIFNVVLTASVTTMEETVRAMSYLVNNGMAYHWGTSEWSVDQITEAFMGILRLEF